MKNHIERLMDWPLQRHVERQATRLQIMMERLDVDPLRMVRLRHGDAYGEARKICLECRNATRCLTWLATPGLPDDLPSFCPNLELLTAAKRMPPGRD